MKRRKGRAGSVGCGVTNMALQGWRYVSVLGMIWFKGVLACHAIT